MSRINRATPIRRLVAAGAALALVPGLLLSAASGAAAASDAFAAKLTAMYANPEVEYRPSVRWWLAEGLNTDATIKSNVQQVYDSGFGAFEALVMPESGAPDADYAWGSDEWNADSQLLVQEAVARGMGFSLTAGTNWTTANLPSTYSWGNSQFPSSTYDYNNPAASQELDYATIPVAAGTSVSQSLPASPARAQSPGAPLVLQSVLAYKVVTARGGNYGVGYEEGTGVGKLDLSSVVDLVANGTVAANCTTACTLTWTPPTTTDDYVIFVYWMHGSGETATPSVSTNYSINYIDSYGVDAMKDYWNNNIFNNASLVSLLQSSGMGEIYMDSLELESYGAGGTLWGYNFLNEFQTRRGYSLVPYLPFISSGTWRVTMWAQAVKTWDWDAGTDADNATLAKVRNDFYDTLSDMYEENTLKPLTDWLHPYNMKLRAEPSYGTPFEISTPAKYLDGIETESYAQNAETDLYRGIGGSANMYGRVFSSETGAISMGNYVRNMDYFTQLAYLQFANGIQRTVFHGYSAIEGSDSDTYWPGHEGMYSFFSERFNERQPASFTYPQWNAMLSRDQKVLRQGVPQRDIAILRTDNAFINYGFESGKDNPDNNYTMTDEPLIWKDLALQQHGYTYDFFSEKLLTDTSNVSWTADALQPSGAAYQAIVVYQESMDLAGAQALLNVANGGLPVVFVNNVTETTACTAGMMGGGGCTVEAHHGKAASVVRSLNDTDAALATVVNAIKALPNVRTINTQSNLLATLRSLGVTPRAGFADPNNTILTQTRLDSAGKIMYTYAYNYKFDVNKGDPATEFEFVFEAVGKPYTLDDWTGVVEPVGTYRIANGKTYVKLALAPGENAIVALNLADTGSSLHAISTTADSTVVDSGKVSVKAYASGTYSTELSSGVTGTTKVTVPAAVALNTWDITVTDWNAGAKQTNTETKFGHTTKEVYFETAETDLAFPGSTLMPWKDLPATAAQLATLQVGSLTTSASMADVSGIGTYSTTFNLPSNWSAANGAELRVGGTGGGTAYVYVNGQLAPGLDLRSLTVDISKLVKPGANTIRIEVASTLTNRIRTMGFPSMFGTPGTLGSYWMMGAPAVQEYGLIGPVTIQPYTIAEVVPPTTPTPKVTVKVPAKPAPTYVTKVKFGQSKVTLAKGKSVTIRPGVYFTKGAATYTSRVTYKSSNTKVAKVDAYGNVKALKAGTAKITATSKLTAKNGKKLSATYTVTVVKKGTKTKVSKLTLPGVPKTLKVGQTLWLTASYTAKGNAQPVKVTYTSLKSGIAGIDAVGKLTGVSKGKDTIVVKAGGKTTKYTITVK